MIRFKPEVRIGMLDGRLVDVLAEAALWSLRARVDVEVNSVNDGPGVHMATSLHYFDCAVDLDTVGDVSSDIDALGEWLRRRLAPGYDVVHEGDHIHVEWDVHRASFTAGAPRGAGPSRA